MAHVDLPGGGDTLAAVVIGAALATLGGVLAGQIEHYLVRREREKNAGLLFGEILAALSMIMRLAVDARSRGDPYGPITMRILKAAHRETVIYDRNRELLFAVRDAVLRARTHILLLQMSLTLDAVFEAAAMPANHPEKRAAQDGSFDFIQELGQQIPELLAKYRIIAKQPFDAHERGANPLAAPRPAEPEGA